MSVQTVLDTKTVLLIEDDLALNRLYESILQKKGYMVNSTDSIRKSLELLAIYMPDYIILDLMLADGLGNEIIMYLNQRKLTNTSVIIISGNIHSIGALANSKQVKHILPKPVDPQELLALIETPN